MRLWSHYVGKIDLNSLLSVKLADVNIDGEEEVSCNPDTGQRHNPLERRVAALVQGFLLQGAPNQVHPLPNEVYTAKEGHQQNVVEADRAVRQTTPIGAMKKTGLRCGK